jgi:23S rRNA pseudouridine955/2504/2580 synthase
MRRARKDAMDGGVIAVPDSRGWGPARRDTPVQHSSFRKIFSMKTRTSATNRDADSNRRRGAAERPPRAAAAPPAVPADVPPRVQTVAVPEDREGQRLDNFLAGRLKGAPKSLIYRICRTGEVRVNGRRAKPDQRLAAGDEVRIPPVRLAEKGDAGPPPNAQLNRIEAAIVYEDRDFLVIDKPAGVASHGGSGVSFGAIELLRAARPRDTLELAHRLDRDTSGVLVLTRKRSALTALQAAIREGHVEKRYLALVEGALPKARLTVDAPLRKSVLQGGERMVRVDPEGKPSRSHFSEVERYAGASLVEVALETGRTHQIRVHAQHLGHPLAGDEKYGDREFNKAMREQGLKRLFLHAARFEFSLGERSYSFSAPLAPELAATLDVLQGRRAVRSAPR